MMFRIRSLNLVTNFARLVIRMMVDVVDGLEVGICISVLRVATLVSLITGRHLILISDLVRVVCNRLLMCR